MASFEEILRRYRLSRVELTSWIEQRWVRPVETPSGTEFDELDQARIALIRDLRRDLMIDDDTLGLVLCLLDQLYAARRMLKEIETAIEALPRPVREQIAAKLRGPSER